MKYIADTSFLIGLFINDSRSQRARDIFNRLKSKREKVFIPLTAMSEVVYVLEKFYNLDRKTVADYANAILNTYIFSVEKYEMFHKIIQDYCNYPEINLGDIIIAAEAGEKKINNILTFDKDYKKLGFRIAIGL